MTTLSQKGKGAPPGVIPNWKVQSRAVGGKGPSSVVAEVEELGAEAWVELRWVLLKRELLESPAEGRELKSPCLIFAEVEEADAVEWVETLCACGPKNPCPVFAEIEEGGEVIWIGSCWALLSEPGKDLF